MRSHKSTRIRGERLSAIKATTVPTAAAVKWLYAIIKRPVTVVWCLTRQVSFYADHWNWQATITASSGAVASYIMTRGRREIGRYSGSNGKRAVACPAKPDRQSTCVAGLDPGRQLDRNGHDCARWTTTIWKLTNIHSHVAVQPAGQRDERLWTSRRKLSAATGGKTPFNVCPLRPLQKNLHSNLFYVHARRVQGDKLLSALSELIRIKYSGITSIKNTLSRCRSIYESSLFYF